MSVAPTHAPSAKQCLQELFGALSDARGFYEFLNTHLADDVVGAVAPRYRLGKQDLLRSLVQFMAMASGGSFSQLGLVEEGASACARVLLSPKKIDVSKPGSINLQKVPVFEWAVWLELNAQGQIKQLSLVGDGLTPAMAMGRQMAQPKP